MKQATQNHSKIRRCLHHPMEPQPTEALLSFWETNFRKDVSPKKCLPENVRQKQFLRLKTENIFQTKFSIPNTWRLFCSACSEQSPQNLPLAYLGECLSTPSF